MRYLLLLLLPLKLFAHDLWVVQQDTIKYGRAGAYELQLREIQNPDSLIASDPLSQSFFILTPIHNVSSYITAQDEKKPEETRLMRVLNAFLIDSNRTLQDLIYDNGHAINRDHNPFLHYEILDVLPGKEDRVEAHLRTKGELLSKKHHVRIYKTLFGNSLPRYLVTVSGENPEDLKRISLISSHMQVNLRSSKSGVAKVLNGARSQGMAKKSHSYKQ